MILLQAVIDDDVGDRLDLRLDGFDGNLVPLKLTLADEPISGWFSAKLSRVIAAWNFPAFMRMTSVSSRVLAASAPGVSACSSG